MAVATLSIASSILGDPRENLMCPSAWYAIPGAQATEAWFERILHSAAVLTMLGEFVPFNEATPSPDGKLWICRRPDKTRRCVFGPPPNS